nr:hypothetical protein CFP56_10465 [Quercus suber]
MLSAGSDRFRESSTRSRTGDDEAWGGGGKNSNAARSKASKTGTDGVCNFDRHRRPSAVSTQPYSIIRQSAFHQWLTNHRTVPVVDIEPALLRSVVALCSGISYVDVSRMAGTGHYLFLTILVRADPSCRDDETDHTWSKTIVRR